MKVLIDRLENETVYSLVGEFETWACSYKNGILTDHTSGKRKRIQGKEGTARKAAGMRLFNYFDNERIKNPK